MDKTYLQVVFWALLTYVSLATSVAETSHTLQYLYTLTLDPAGKTSFVSAGYLDGVQIDHYDSQSQRDVPMVDWMSQGSRFWDAETEARKDDQGRFSAMMKDTFNHSSGELHTFQAMCECGFAPGLTWGGIRNAHNGQAFLTFDRESLGWLAVAPSVDHAAAVRVKRQWERWRPWSRDVGIYVDQICLERLRSFLEYGKKALERTKSPDVTILTTSKHEAICLATGYYPHGATVHWVRSKSHELVPERMIVGGEELPNGDGTFQTRLTLRHMNEEEVEYKCRVEHSSLETPVMRTLEKPRSRALAWLPWIFPVFLIIVVVVVLKAKQACERRSDQVGQNEAGLPQETKL